MASNSSSVVIATICMHKCNHAYLSDWLRLLRSRTAGGWEQRPLALVADELNAAAAGRMDPEAIVALVSGEPPLSITLPPSTPNATSSLTVEQLDALQKHMASAAVKSKLLQLPELKGFETIIYLDVDLWPIRSIHHWIKRQLHAVQDVGMARDTTNALCTNAIILRRTASTAKCMKAWHAAMRSHMEIAQQALLEYQLPECRSLVKGVPTRIDSIVTMSCFKDQYALDVALRDSHSACARSITKLPQLALRWRFEYEVRHVELSHLLQDPSAESPFLAWAAVRYDKGANSQSGLQLPFVHFDRFERQRALVARVETQRYLPAKFKGRTFALDEAATAFGKKRDTPKPLGASGLVVRSTWLRSDPGTRGGMDLVLHMRLPTREHSCTYVDGSIYLIGGIHANGSQRLDLSLAQEAEGFAKDTSRTPPVLRVHSRGRELLGPMGSSADATPRAHALTAPLPDVNHVGSVLLDPLGPLEETEGQRKRGRAAESQTHGASREIWTLCGFNSSMPGTEQVIEHILVTELPSMRTRLGPRQMDGVSGACAALALHVDGFGEPPLPCAFGGSRGPHATKTSYSGARCYDRRTGGWRRPFGKGLPFAFDHAAAVKIPPGACAAGAPGHVLLFNVRTFGVQAGPRSTVWAYDLGRDGKPIPNGHWYAFGKTDADANTGRVGLNGSSVVVSTDGRFVFEFGGLSSTVHRRRPPGHAGQLVNLDFGSPGFSLARVAQGRGWEVLVATSQVRAFDVCGSRRWLIVGAMQRPRMGHASCVVHTADDAFTVSCGGTYPRYWPESLGNEDGPGGGMDRLNLDTCEVFSMRELQESARRQLGGGAPAASSARAGSV